MDTELTGTTQVIKDAFDKLVALAFTAPVFLAVALIIQLDDRR